MLTDATLISAPTSSINSTLRLLVSNALKYPPPDSLMLVNVKPAELAAAIRNLLNRLAPKSVTNKWTLDTKLMIVRFQSTTSIELLKILALNNGCVHIETMQALLQDESLDCAKSKLRLEVLISRLRAKLSPYSSDLDPIKSVRGKGYQLCVDVEIQ